MVYVIAKQILSTYAASRIEKAHKADFPSLSKK